MPPLSPEQMQYVVGGSLVAIAGAVAVRVVSILDRIPEKAWFERVEAHMKRGDEQAYRIATAEEALRKGRARMGKIDEHLEATDVRVDSHATRIAVLESK